MVNPCHSQLPRLSDLGEFLFNYKENKFYWGLSFDFNGNIKSIDQKKYRLVSKSGSLQRGRFIQTDNQTNLYMEFDENENVVEIKYNYSTQVKTNKYINVYNENKQLIEIKVCGADGKLKETYTQIYDENNKIIEIKGANAKGAFINKKTYKYDTIGHIIEKEWIVDSNTYKKYVYSYDENDNLIEIVYTNLNYTSWGEIIFQIAFEATVCSILKIDPPDPNDPNDPAYGSQTNSSKNTFLRIEKKYDDHKNVIEESIYNIEYQTYPGALIEKYTAEYDVNGKILKELRTQFKSDANTSVELHHNYDENGYKIGTHLIFVQYDLKTEIKSTIINDEYGKVIEIIENLKNPFNKIKFSEKFEYDSNNNISRIYFFKKDKPKYVIERKIEYF